MPYNKTVDSILKLKKVKVTANRGLVLKVFLKNKTALSLSKLEDHLYYLDRTSIYRTLKTFTTKGILHQINDGSRLKKFALCKTSCSTNKHVDNHPHFFCNNCKTTTCLDQLSNPQINLKTDHIIKSTDLIINGTCHFCNQVA